MLILDEQITREIKQSKRKAFKAALVELKIYSRIYLEPEKGEQKDLRIVNNAIAIRSADKKDHYLFNSITCDGDRLILEFLTIEQVFKWCESYQQQWYNNTQEELC